jgi:pimeloyl-ACP methyl ester carboxylesterase
MGALCALEASLLTADIARLVLHEPPVANAAAVPREILERMLERLAEGDREGLMMIMLRDVVGMTEEDIAAFKATPAYPARLAAVHTVPRELREGMRYRFQPERFAGMDVPTRILLGSESTPIDAKSAFMVHRALPNSQLVLLQGVEHVAIHRDPDLVVNEVTRFLSETAS